MSFSAWLYYSYTYAISALKLPLSLTLWQHVYSLNMLFVVQETADAFGLLLLGLLCLSAQLFSRNYMFSIFTLASNKESTLGLTSSAKANKVKNLTTANSFWYSLAVALSPIKIRFKSIFKG